MELERGKKCADAQMLVPSHARKTQLISQAVKSSFLLYDGNWHCLTWSMAPLLLHFRSRWFVWSTVWRFRFLLYSGPLWVLRDSEPPGVARNTAKTLGSLKSLTLKFKALVLHNLDWAESSSIIKVIYYICNHWDYLYRFVGIVLFSSIVMLWDLQGGYGWLQDEHVDWDAAHKREELRFCLMQDFVFFPGSRLCCETHICLHLPTACFSPSNGRSNQTREICSCFIDEGRGLCLVLVSPIDFWPCGFLSSRFPKLLAVSWLDIPFSMYSDTHQLPCIRPCLPTSHRWGETCEGFSSFRPTQLVAVRGYTVYVNPFWRHVCIPCSVSAWTLGCIWGRGLIAECLDSMAEKVCSSAFHIKFLAFLFRIQGGKLIPVLLPVIICLLFMVFLRTGKWIEWMNESSGICFTVPNVFSRCFRRKRDEKGIKSDEGVGFWMLLLKSVCWVHWHRPADLISRTCRRRRAAQGNGRARGTLLTSLRLEPQWCFGAMWRLQFLDVFGVEVWDRWITKDYLRFLCNTLQLYLNYVGLIYPVHCHMSSPLL